MANARLISELVKRLMKGGSDPTSAELGQPLNVLKNREQSIQAGRPGANESPTGRKLIDRGYDLDELDRDNPFRGFEDEFDDAAYEAEVLSRPGGPTHVSEQDYFDDLAIRFKQVTGRSPTPEELRATDLEDLILMLENM